MILQDSKISRKNLIFSCLFLIVIVLSLYARVSGFQFINLDDDVYVFENPHLRNGLTIENVQWALQADLLFNSPNADYWQPVTFISRMIDVSLFGFNPSGHHLMNLFFHTANTLLLFGLLIRMTGAIWPSFAVALLFAIHPMNVEPVAWVTARKDLLSWFFGFLSIHTFLNYVNCKKKRQMVLSVCLFLLALMSKPVLVSLPFLLVLLDFWPLKRFNLSAIREKGVYFLVSLPFFVIPFVGQAQALRYASYPIIAASMVINNVYYLSKVLCPIYLRILSWTTFSAFPFVLFSFSALILTMITFVFFQLRQSKPYLLVGWLWFLISLFPMAGISPVADRFMYVPIIGLLMIFVLEIYLNARKYSAPLFIGAAVVFFILSFRQLSYWKNNETLFQHSIKTSSGNFIAHNNLAITMIEQGKAQQATELYSEAQKMRPDVITNTNLASALAKQGQIDEAMKHFKESLRLNPNYAEAHNNLANLLMKEGKTEEAVSHYLKAAELKPDLPEAHANLGFFYANQREYKKAIEHLSEVVRLKPDHWKAHYYLANLLMESGQAGDALGHFREAVKLQPNDVSIQSDFGIALASAGDYENAEMQFLELIRLAPRFADAYYNLGVLYSKQNKMEQAIRYLKDAVQINPQYTKAKNALGLLESQIEANKRNE